MAKVTPSADNGDVSPEGGTKKKKLTSMMEKSDGRRLVEYLVVVSSVPRIKQQGGGGVDGDGKPAAEGGEDWNLSTSFDDEDVEVDQGFKPIITARYPLHDHEDNPLHEQVTFFCHPSGAIQLKKEPYMPKVSTQSKSMECAMRVLFSTAVDSCR